MLQHIINILDYIITSFIHIWPYLLLTIPIAVAVKMSGASKFIERAFTARPIIAIFLATFVGAFSPLCSCSVIPVIAAMLIGGVPLAPVMSFWLASPSMDPEIFFLTVSSLGWELATWRMIATLLMSLGGGLITHYLVKRNLLGQNILRDVRSSQVKTLGGVLKQAWIVILEKIQAVFSSKRVPQPAAQGITLSFPQARYSASQEISSGSSVRKKISNISTEIPLRVSVCSCDDAEAEAPDLPKVNPNEEQNSCCGAEPQSSAQIESDQSQKSDFWKRMGKETWTVTIMVIKFMLLAWLIGAIIRLYVPESWITSTLGAGNSWAILTAAVLGIPVYTGNMSAMPLVGGLLAQGMNPGAALAFLISGPTTTLPAMSAVWGLVNRKVFGLYIGFSLVTALILGYLYSFFG